MNLHLLAGVGVLSLLIAVSAWREALRNEPISRIRITPENMPQFKDKE
ncbi:hypothetical protein AB4Y32_22935 [Paraburkholderia phymatum]|uniref:Uncharacterized protein n=1 Tax=Paraburkholderia phymatum TaxID=148447 RepID=A0ACC6U4J6_9BURK